MTRIAPYAKAVIAALVAFLGVVGSGLTDGHLDGSEWVAAAVAGLTALGVVYQVRNEPVPLDRPGA